MFNNLVKGRVWIFGDNISTDLIMPGFAAMSDPNMTLADSAKYCMYANRPGWAEKVQPGDIIIAGKNFGCGSSRPGSKLLIELGISLVISESMSRIFFRNSINLGLPVLTCPGIREHIHEGDSVEADLYTGIIRNLTTGRTIVGESLPSDSPPIEILKAGGLIAMLTDEIKERNEKHENTH